MKYYSVLLATSFCLLLVNSAKVQTAAVDNKLSQTITLRPIPKGPSVLGTFQGRPLCLGLVTQLGIETDADCTKLKWSLSLYQDPATLQPTRYTLSIVGGGDVVQQEGSAYRQKVLEGQWTIVKGIKSNHNAEVYQLELGKQGAYLYLLKGDDNVLFILDENRDFRIGNGEFSYTLNRVELIPKK